MPKTLTINAPEGYEFTGEIRLPKAGEHYYADGIANVAVTSFRNVQFPILRKLKQRVLVLPLTPEIEAHVTSGTAWISSEDLSGTDIGSDYAIEDRE